MKQGFTITSLVLFVGLLVLWTAGMIFYREPTATENEVTIITVLSEDAEPASFAPTERYRAQVDRVKVLFEQWDYTRYRLQTNELVREGEMNSERGFGDDTDAVVYVLNWLAPESEQIRYVRLTAEPERLYALDGYNNLIMRGPLMLE